MRPLELKAKIIDSENKEKAVVDANLQNTSSNPNVVPKQEDKCDSNILPPIPEVSSGSSNETSRRSSVWNRAISSLESRFQVNLYSVFTCLNDFIVKTFSDVFSQNGRSNSTKCCGQKHYST